MTKQVCPCCSRALRSERKATKPAAMTGEQFFDARMVACHAVAADVGPNAEDRAADIQRAWDARRELIQARRDAAMLAADIPLAA